MRPRIFSTSWNPLSVCAFFLSACVGSVVDGGDAAGGAGAVALGSAIPRLFSKAWKFLSACVGSVVDGGDGGGGAHSFNVGSVADGGDTGGGAHSVCVGSVVDGGDTLSRTQVFVLGSRWKPGPQTTGTTGALNRVTGWGAVG